MPPLYVGWCKWTTPDPAHGILSVTYTGKVDKHFELVRNSSGYYQAKGLGNYIVDETECGEAYREDAENINFGRSDTTLSVTFRYFGVEHEMAWPMSYNYNR